MAEFLGMVGETRRIAPILFPRGRDQMTLPPQEQRRGNISADQRRALRLLAGNPFGCTEAIMLAHGFKAELLAFLVRRGLATTQPGTVRAGRRKIEVVWMMITDAGQRALAGK